MKIYELTPNCSRAQKSFYGKARVWEENGKYILWSYETVVCVYDGEFHRTWGGWSATTAKHIDSFRRSVCGLEGISKKDWCALPVRPWNYAQCKTWNLEKGA